MTQVAAIGLDAAEWPLLARLLDAGALPELAAVRRRSVLVPLANDVMGTPEEAWTRFAFDSDPAASMWSNLAFDPATYRSFRRGTFPAPPFFARPGIRPLAFDLPKSTVVADGSGTYVTTWGAHGSAYPRSSYPKGLLTEIDDRFGPHPAFGNDFENAWFQPDFIEELRDGTCRGAGIRAEATRWLLQRVPEWNLFVTALSEPHSAGHHFWHGVDPEHLLAGTPTAALAGSAMEDVHRAVDAALGQIVAALPDDAIQVVFALHGMTENDSDVAAFLLLPELLHRFHGWPARLGSLDHARWRRKGCPPVVPHASRRPLAAARERFDETALRRLRRLSMSTSLAHALRARGMGTNARRAWRPIEDAPGELDIDTIEARHLEEGADEFPNLWYQAAWPRMRAFALPSFGEGRIRINLAGRERDGLVALDDYAATCHELERLLRETINPRTGASVVADIRFPLLDDPFASGRAGADLLISWTPAIDAFAHPELGPIGPFPVMRTGEHSNHGFALVSGPGIAPGETKTAPAEALPRLLLDLVRGVAPTEALGQVATTV